MIKITKKEIKSCCGKKQNQWKLSVSLRKEFLPALEAAGFFYLRSFYDAGMLYIEDNGLIASGVFGLGDLTVKCKNKKCEDSMILLEKTITHLE